MITKTTGYQSSDGMIHGSLALAQKAELMILLVGDVEAELGKSEMKDWSEEEIADCIVKNQEKVLDILTMKASSKPRARKINGGTKTRAKKSTRHEAEQFPLPMEDNPKDAA